MKKSLLLIPVFCFLISCNLFENLAYDAFISGSTPLSTDTVNTLQVGDTVYVELGRGIPYSWHYTNTSSSVLIFLEEETFNFNAPYTVGGGEDIVWKFRAAAAGNTSLIYKYQFLDDATNVSQSNVYDIIVN